jgi:S-methylmethionine-dependent homocysteine/selenocysteine methylase
MNAGRLDERLARGDVVILDGATGTELERRGVPMDSQAWSATANLTHPDVVRTVHEDYIRAGADLVITNTFATARCHLEAAGLGERVVEVNRRAVELAREARDRAAAGRDVWIAASMSTMAPGAEPARRPSVLRLSEMLREQADILARAGADLLVLEMMRDVDYAAGAVDAARATGLPVWVGFSCRRAADGTVTMFSGVRDDLAFKDVIAPVMARGGSLLAVMHSEVSDTGPAIDVAKRHWKGPLAAYPESGHFTMPNWQFVDVMAPEAFVTHAMDWLDQGVQVLGGCCGLGPEHIRLLRERLPARLPRPR